MYVKGRGIEHTDLGRDVAGLLHAGSDAADQLGLLAVALEVEELRAAVAAEGRHEARQLEESVVTFSYV